MPLVEVASELLGTVFRFVGQVLIDVVAEVIVKGPGYLICRLFSRDVDPNGMRVAVVSILFWITLVMAAWAAWESFLKRPRWTDAWMPVVRMTTSSGNVESSEGMPNTAAVGKPLRDILAARRDRASPSSSDARFRLPE